MSFLGCQPMWLGMLSENETASFAAIETPTTLEDEFQGGTDTSSKLDLPKRIFGMGHLQNGQSLSYDLTTLCSYREFAPMSSLEMQALYPLHLANSPYTAEYYETRRLVKKLASEMPMRPFPQHFPSLSMPRSIHGLVRACIEYATCPFIETTSVFDHLCKI